MILRCSLGWQRRRPTCSTYDSRVAICHGLCGLFSLFSFFAPSFCHDWAHVWCRKRRLDNRLSPRLLPSQQAKNSPTSWRQLALYTWQGCLRDFLAMGSMINCQIFALPMYVLSDSETPNLVLLGRVVGEKGQVESKKKDSKIKDVIVFLIDVGVRSKPQK